MQDLLEYIVSSILGKSIQSEFTEDEREYHFVIHLSEDDMGLVIGKRGSVIKAIRSLVKVQQPDPKKFLVIKLEPAA